MQENRTHSPMHIEISDELLEFLTPAKADNAYSRCDAFRDLVVRATSSAGHLSYLGYDFDLQPGEFIITMTDLAKLWKWYRRTVRFFIEDLQLLGVLQVISYQKFQHVDMVALRFNTTEDVNPCSPEKTQDDLQNVPHVESQNVPHVLHANVPLNVINSEGDSCGTFCQMFGFNPAGTHSYSSEQRKELANVALTVVSPLYFTSLKSLFTPRVEKILLDTLYKRCNGSLDEFKEILGKLAVGFEAGLPAKNITAAIESLANAPESAPDASKASETVDSTPKPPKAKRTRKNKAKQ